MKSQDKASGRGEAMMLRVLRVADILSRCHLDSADEDKTDFNADNMQKHKKGLFSYAELVFSEKQTYGSSKE